MRALSLLALLAVAGALAVAALLVVLAGEDAPVAESARRVERAAGEAVGRPAVRPVRCPDGVPGCRAVTGRVVLVESVDPDGDGDLHVVLAGGSVTAPGLTAVDIAPGLRPRHDPRIGDELSVAGPVQRGSHRQRQIHALRLRAAR